MSKSEQSVGLPDEIEARFKSQKELETAMQGLSSILLPVVTALLAIGSSVFLYVGIPLYIVYISIVLFIQQSFRPDSAGKPVTRPGRCR